MTNCSRVALLLLSLSTLVWGAARPEGIRGIDFKNFSFPWDEGIARATSSTWHWIASRPQTLVRVENGVHSFHEPGQIRQRAGTLRVIGVTYGDLDGDGSEEAAVHLNYGTRGTRNWDYLYVYKLVGGQTKLVGLLVSGERGNGGLVGNAIQNGSLVLDFADPDRRVGDCCSDGYIRVRYRLQNGAFVQEGPQERGDMPLNVR